MRQTDAQASDATDIRTLCEATSRSQGVVLYDLDGTILEANSVFLNCLGFSAGDLVGRNFDIFQAGAVPGIGWSQVVAAVSAGGSLCLQRLPHLGNNGPTSWLRSTFSPVPGSDGTPARILQTTGDVTDMVRHDTESRAALEAIKKSQAVVVFDPDGLILDANQLFLDAMGYRLDEIVGRHHRTFVEPSYAHSAEYAAFWRQLARGEHQSGQYRRFTRFRTEVWLQAFYNPVLDTHGKVGSIVKLATPVTEEKLRQADLQGQLAAIDKSQGLISFDLQGNILSANANFSAAVGYASEELVGQNHRILVDPEFAASAEYDDIWNTLRSGSFVSGLYRRIRKGGQVVWIQASYNPILDLNGRPERILKFATDVTSNIELAAAYEDAKRQSQHDPGTALPNRVRLLGFMEAILAQPDARLNLLYLDLDRFKPVNDKFGHEVGDFVLARTADRLRRCLTSEQLAARIGGDEFVVAAPNLTSAELEELCTALVASISAPIQHNGDTIKVGVSIGVATSADANSSDELLRCADAAMYRCKQNGRGSFAFYADIPGDRLAASRNLSEELERALADGEFFLDYQPRFDTATNAIASVEALVRWQHPQRGLVSPLEFVPDAERTGAIVRLGAWVLRRACQDARDWPGIGVSVNVSPVQFQAGTLVETVAAVLNDTGLAPARLELEVTENVVIGDIDLVRTTLVALKRLSVRISMDDFGTGYSSFSNLRALPFDALKIDRQFIRDMDTRNGGREVVQAILALGKALDLRVTAEGVETPSQLSMLTTDQCSELQGFLLARPMPPSQITTWLERGLPAQPVVETFPPRLGFVRRTPRKVSRQSV